MDNINILPKEVLHEITSYLETDIQDVRNLASVSKCLSLVASAALYRHIDFNHGNDYEFLEVSKKRQLRLLKSIADNPKLGALVKTFNSYWNLGGYHSYRDNRDANSIDEENAIALSAAKNMVNLSRAELSHNHFGSQILDNLQNYPNLVDLRVCGFRPQDHMWGQAPVSLKKINWNMPRESMNHRELGPESYNAWDSAQLLIDVAATTCPGLESLGIIITHREDGAPGTSPPSTNAAQQYQSIIPNTSRLPSLKHFSFHYNDYEYQNREKANLDMIDFISKHPHITSLSIDLGSVNGSRREPDLLEVCRMLPNLKVISLSSSHAATEQAALDFWSSITKGLASPAYEIESLSVRDLCCSFSPQLGSFFQSWKSLKSLRVGDKDNEYSAYGSDGRPQFKKYAPKILGFVKALPPSLEEIYVEFNGEQLCVYEDEEFDPMCNLGVPAFIALPRLHTFDVHAWISDIDVGGPGTHPEKGVFYRRLPLEVETSTNSSKLKVLWTSRMDSVYQEDWATVVKKFEAITGEFEGRDAEELWLEGYKFAEVVPATTRGRAPDYVAPDHSWPSWHDAIAEYKGWRKDTW